MEKKSGAGAAKKLAGSSAGKRIFCQEPEPGVFGPLEPEPEPLGKKIRSRSRLKIKSGAGAAITFAGSPALSELKFFVGIPPSVQYCFVKLFVPLNARVTGYLDLTFRNLSPFRLKIRKIYRKYTKQGQIVKF